MTTTTHTGQLRCDNCTSHIDHRGRHSKNHRRRTPIRISTGVEPRRGDNRPSRCEIPCGGQSRVPHHARDFFCLAAAHRARYLYSRAGAGPLRGDRRARHCRGVRCDRLGGKPHASLARRERPGRTARLRPGAAVALHDWTWEVLTLCARLHQLSKGCFDPCLESAPGRMSDLDLTEPGRVVVRAGVHVDLGGIAKGFAVDKAIEALRASGCEGGLVNAAATLRCSVLTATNFSARGGWRGHTGHSARRGARKQRGRRPRRFRRNIAATTMAPTAACGLRAWSRWLPAAPPWLMD